MSSVSRYLSYSLFTKKQVGPSRPYDLWEYETNRYWFNLPALAIANAFYYPGFQMRIHVDLETHEHPLFPMLMRMDQRGLVEVKTCGYPYQHTEPTFWRMEPVWREQYDVVLCRDIDSLPNTREAQATIAFVESDFLIQSMRSHPHHNNSYTLMLAGLLGFHQGIKAHLEGTFEDYYGMAGGHWGTDQDTLTRYFIHRLGPEFVKAHFLDTCIHAFDGQMSEYVAGHYAGKIAQEVYDAVDISRVPQAVRERMDLVTQWPGQPVDARGETGRILLDYGGETARAVLDCMTHDHAATEFYRF
jgi:hypothetical protein